MESESFSEVVMAESLPPFYLSYVCPELIVSGVARKVQPVVSKPSRQGDRDERDSILMIEVGS